MKNDENYIKYLPIIDKNKSLVYALMKEITELKEELDILSEKNKNFGEMLTTMCDGCILKKRSIDNNKKY